MRKVIKSSYGLQSYKTSQLVRLPVMRLMAVLVGRSALELKPFFGTKTINGCHITA